MTTTPELVNVHRAADAAVGHVIEKTDQLEVAAAGLRAQLDRAAGLSDPHDPDDATARGLLDAASAFVALVATLRPVETGWR